MAVRGVGGLLTEAVSSSSAGWILYKKWWHGAPASPVYDGGEMPATADLPKWSSIAPTWQ